MGLFAPRAWLTRVLGLVAASAAQLAAAQGLPMAEPEALGVSSERLARVEALIDAAIANEEIAGAVALIARHGRVAYLQPFGMADIDDGEPMQADTIFRIASMTKPVTSLAVMMLHEEGHFLLDDPVSRFIPELGNPRVLTADDGSVDAISARGEITIQQLLTHTSGISYGFNGDAGRRATIAQLYRDAGISDGLSQTEGRIADLSKRLGSVPLLFEPGTEYAYGLSVDVLGHLVEVVSGMMLAEFFEQRIFAPLAMHDTHFYLDAPDVERLASVYVPDDRGGLRELADDETIEAGYLVYSGSYHFKGPRTYYSGGAGLVSTASDYARLLQMFLNGGELDGVRLLSPTTVELMTRNGIGELSVGPGRKFGLGFAVVEDPGRAGVPGSPGTYYWGGFFNTRFFVDPGEGLIGIFLSQRYPRDAGRLRDRFINVAYQAIVD
ncbi:MAG TPA: serine hydrolase domain-containing protein [Gammaproteobacteria bacterium]|jgi:CubicO group peptidase (beta-lactamase class C family)